MNNNYKFWMELKDFYETLGRENRSEWFTQFCAKNAYKCEQNALNNATSSYKVGE